MHLIWRLNGFKYLVTFKGDITLYFVFLEYFISGASLQYLNGTGYAIYL